MNFIVESVKTCFQRHSAPEEYQALPHMDPINHHPASGTSHRNYWMEGWTIQVYWIYPADRLAFERELYYYRWGLLKAWEKAALLFALGNYYSTGKSSFPNKRRKLSVEVSLLEEAVNMACHVVTETYMGSY